MQVKIEMKHKVRKEPEGGSKKRKEVGNDNSLFSMFAKQQAASAMKKESKRRIQCTASERNRNWVAGSRTGRACAKVRYGHTLH
jgi:hypothetical protein